MSENRVTGPWSYSRATMCPKAAYDKYVLHLPDLDRPAAMLDIDRTLMGSALHHGVDVLIGNIIAEKPWPDDMNDFVVKDIIEYEEKGKKPYAPIVDEIGEVSNRLDMFKNKFLWTEEINDLELRDAHIKETCLGHEVKLGMTDDGKPAPYDKCPVDGWRGKIDYAAVVDEKTLFFRDFKNSPYILTPEEIRTHEQLSVYSKLLGAEYADIEFFDIGLYLFQYGIEISDVLTRGQVEWNFKKTQARAHALGSMKEFPPIPGHGKCQYCHRLAVCDVGLDAVQDMNMASMTDLAKGLYRKTNEIERMKKELLGFVRENGNVYIDDETFYGYALPSNPSWSWDRDATIQTLIGLVKEKKIPGPVANYMSLDGKAVKKLCRDPELDKRLSSVRTLTTKPTMKFGRLATSTPVSVEKKGRSFPVKEDDLKMYEAKVLAGGRKK